MSRVLIPSPGPDAWQQFLAKPDLQWRTGFSARTLAYAWEQADGMPVEIESLLTKAIGHVDLLCAIPELKTPLPGGQRESQSDVFALVRHANGLAGCTIEGKVDEPFGPTVGEWAKEGSAGKRTRLAAILSMLGLDACAPHIRYQLLHRTAAALIEADRFAATHACMIVHSFSPRRTWFTDFQAFCGLFGAEAEIGSPSVIALSNGKNLILGWACGDPRFLTY